MAYDSASEGLNTVIKSSVWIRNCFSASGSGSGILGQYRSKKMMSKIQEKPPALKREHLALLNMKFLYFFLICGSSLPSWIRIQSININADPIQINILIQIHNTDKKDVLHT